MTDYADSAKKLGEILAGAVARHKEGLVTLKLPLDPEKFYFYVDCAKCGEDFALCEAPSPLENSDIKHSTVKDQPCPHCGHVTTYPPKSIKVRLGPAGRHESR